jgi:RNA polymerase sigma factor for flagellar operon FliA
MKPTLALVPACSPTQVLPSAPAAQVSESDIRKFMPLVHMGVARMLRRLPRTVRREDLLAAGTYGLFDALRKNGSGGGPKFEWYARMRIRGAIVDQLRSQDWLSRRARRVKIRAVDGPATFCGVVPLDDMSDAQRDEACVGTASSPLQAVEARAERGALSKAIELLGHRERVIVTLYYCQGVQLKTIAAQLGVSEARVSQLRARAVLRLRALLPQYDLTKNAA